MSELFTFLPEGGWQRLAADAIWQSTLVAAAALLLVRTLLRERPAARAAVALLAAGLCIAAPLVSLAARAGGVGMLTGDARALVAAASTERLSPREASIATAAPVVDAAVDSDLVRSTGAVHRAWQAFGVVWLAAAGFLLSRLSLSAVAVARMRRTAVRYDGEDALDELDRAATRLEVGAPLLLTSDTIAAPTLVAWRRPALLLPNKTFNSGELHAVFCHELAHLARRDGWSRLALELLLVMLPWQPLAWLLRREFRTASEEACDDWAVASGCDPVEFAAVLTDYIPQRSAALALGMAESVPAARHRILRLLAMQSMPKPRLGVFLGVTGWVVALSLLVLLAMLQRGQWPWRDGEDLPPWGNSPVVITDKEIGETKWGHEPYVIEPPDVLMIDVVKLVPKPPQKLEPLDVLQIIVVGTLGEEPIQGPYTVEADGIVSLGFSYGSVHVGGLTLTEARKAVTEHLQKFLNAPEVYLTLAQAAGQQHIKGEHLVGPDGRVNLGTYGSVFVAGLTIADARKAIEKHLEQFLQDPQVSVDVQKYNSKVYYVIIEGVRGSVGHVIRVPLTGNDRVLDALAQIPGFSHLSEKFIWIARPAPDGGIDDTILPVDWNAIVKGGNSRTNWQLLPGDRLFVREKK